jgi:hypothetical protein
MSKNKVVSIEQFSPRPGAPRLIAKSQTQIGDVRHQRFILKMFNQRIAFDFASRVTRLEPETVGHPPPVIPMKNGPKRKTKRDLN